MGLGATLKEAATAGLAGAVTGGIGSIISGGLGLIGGLFKKNNNGFKNQQKLMQQAWEYEKEGMGLQYNYGQQAADAEYRRNLQMWKDTNFGAQRQEMEDAGRSGAGGSGRELVDYASNVFESNALPYLNQLSGMAGFGFGPGASGQLYGQYGSMATGAPFQGLDSLARAIGSSQPSVAPWQLAAYNAQQQMQGMGPGRNFTLS